MFRRIHSNSRVQPAAKPESKCSKRTTQSVSTKQGSEPVYVNELAALLSCDVRPFSLSVASGLRTAALLVTSACEVAKSVPSHHNAADMTDRANAQL